MSITVVNTQTNTQSTQSNMDTTIYTKEQLDKMEKDHLEEIYKELCVFRKSPHIIEPRSKTKKECIRWILNLQDDESSKIIIEQLQHTHATPYTQSNVIKLFCNIPQYPFREFLDDKITTQISKSFTINTCSSCGHGNLWLGNPLHMVLYHKNGNTDDKSIENLKILCPICNDNNVRSRHIKYLLENCDEWLREDIKKNKKHYADEKHWSIADLFLRQFLNNCCDGFGLNNVVKVYKYILKHKEYLTDKGFISMNGWNNSGYPLWKDYDFETKMNDEQINESQNISTQMNNALQDFHKLKMKEEENLEKCFEEYTKLGGKYKTKQKYVSLLHLFKNSYKVIDEENEEITLDNFMEICDEFRKSAKVSYKELQLILDSFEKYFDTVLSL